MVRINREIKVILEARRDRARADLDQRKAEAWARIPELADLDQKITREGIHHARMVIRGDSGVADAEALARRITELKKEKEKLLLNNGYPADFLEPASPAGSVGIRDLSPGRIPLKHNLAFAIASSTLKSSIRFQIFLMMA